MNTLARRAVVGIALLAWADSIAAQDGRARRSNGKGFRVSLGASAIAVSPEGASSSAGVGPTFSYAWGFGDRVSVFMGFDVAYGVRMLDTRSVYGRFDILGVRYALANRARATIPFVELMYAETDFGRSQDSVDATDTQWSGRIGVEHYFSLGQAIEVSIGPGFGTLDNHDSILGTPATITQKFTAWHGRVQMNWRPWSRRRKD